MPIAALIFTSQIEDLEHEADTLKDRYLRQQGWKHHCDSPGSFWLWEKMLPDGRHFICDRGTALAIEEHLTCSACGKGHDVCACDPEDCW